MIDESIFNSLNDVQKKAVLDTEGQLLVLAGAGSGKTRVLTSRVAHLVKNCGVDPYNILAITFTNKAAAEMKNRIKIMLGVNVDVWISTFHSMCAQILFRECEHLGYNSNFSIYSDVESGRLIKQILKTYVLNGEDGISKVYEPYFKHIKHIKGYNLDVEDYVEILDDKKEKSDILKLYKDYQNELKKSNSMDFDDLLLNTFKLFKDFPDVLNKYKSRFQYIHVDEFQDTNSIQYEIVTILSGKDGNLFVVGDEDQSIYSWRGAIISNILNFKKEFPNAKVYKLEQNYRSTSYILNAANRVIAYNSQRLGKQLFTDKQGGKRVEVFNAYNDREEVDYIVRNVKDLIQLANYNFCDFAVLMRANSLSRQFEDAFNKYSIPYRVYGGIKFYDRREIKELCAYLKIAINPDDADSAIRVINIPRRAIGETTVAKIVQYATLNNISFYETVKNIENINIFNAGTIKKIITFRNIWYQIISKSKDMEPIEFVEYVFKTSGLEELYKSDKEDTNRYDNIIEFITAVKEFQLDNPNTRIDEFMRMVALISDIDKKDVESAVTLTTIHAVKGLEFPVVFIIGLEESIFPTNRALNDCNIEKLEEERRLMYVAITRAEERLYCSSTRCRFRFNQHLYNPRSRFIDEMIGSAPTIKPNINQPDNKANGKSKLQTGYVPYKGNMPTSKSSINPAEFTTGKFVSHSKFGKGTIISTSGEGNEKIANIQFEGLGIKKFVISIANMKIIK